MVVDSAKGELIAGGAAAAAFLGSLAFLGWSWILVSAVAGVAVYFGVKFLLPNPPVAPPPITIDERLRRIAHMALEFSDPMTRNLVVRVEREGRALQASLVGRPSEEVLTSQHLAQVQEALELILRRNVRLSESAETRSQLHGLLETSAERLMGLRHGISKDHDRDLASEIQLMRETLKDVDELYVQWEGVKQ